MTKPNGGTLVKLTWKHNFETKSTGNTTIKLDTQIKLEILLFSKRRHGIENFTMNLETQQSSWKHNFEYRIVILSSIFTCIQADRQVSKLKQMFPSEQRLC